jgi:hypothetical protein
MKLATTGAVETGPGIVCVNENVSVVDEAAVTFVETVLVFDEVTVVVYDVVVVYPI